MVCRRRDLVETYSEKENDSRAVENYLGGHLMFDRMNNGRRTRTNDDDDDDDDDDEEWEHQNRHYHHHNHEAFDI